MQYTENYSLKLPGYGDNADVGDLNDNTTAIDALIHANRQIEAPAFSTTIAYTAGQMCVYENVLYKFTADKAAGNWDSTKVTATNLADEVTDAAQSGGTEVEANPVEAATADLHKLKVDTTVYGIPDPTVTKTATGNPIEFTDGADAPLVKCVTEIQGSQDLHGYDKPWVGGAGKNKLPMTVSGIKSANTSGTWSGNAYTLNGVTFTIETDGDDNVTGIKANGTSTADWVLLNIPAFTLTAGNYILNGCINGALESYRIDMTPSGTTNLNGDTAFSVSADSQFAVRCIIRQSGYTINNVMFYPMIRLSTVTDPTFEPYSNICPITAYTEGEIEVRGRNEYVTTNTTAQSNSAAVDIVNATSIRVYRNGTGTYPASKQLLSNYNFIEGKTYKVKAYANVVSGIAEIAIRDSSNNPVSASSQISTSGNLEMNFTYNPNTMKYLSFFATYNQSTGGDVTYERIAIYDIDVVPTTHTTTYPSAIYRGSEDVVNGKVTTEWGMIASYAGETLPGEWISDRDEYAPGTTPTTGAQVAYELSTPTTSSVTPTNLPIKSLSGYTHIESSTGEMEVEYITQTYQPIVDLIDEAAEAKLDIYSTTEHVVGKWIDGSDVYENVIVTEFNNAAPQYTLDLSSIGGVSTMPIFVSHSVLDAMEGSTPIKQITMPAATNITYSSISVQHQSSAVTGKAYITVRYIKTSSNNRSLSKGATDGLRADLSEEKNESEESVDKVDKVDKVDEPTETIEEKEENAGESNSENER